MQRIALGIEYDGSHFCGWQRQVRDKSVQAEVEQALSCVADQPIRVHCAGRTDSGVHATSQVVHFDTDAVREDRAWVFGVNRHLPTSISVRWVKEVPDDFHARFSALSRRYCYLIYNHRSRPAIYQQGLTWQSQELDVERMQQATNCLVGKHDFSSFRAAGCQAKTAVRNMLHCKLSRQHNLIALDIKANAFLHHMVRNIAGSLMKIGKGEQPVDWMETVLAARDRKVAGMTASARGLHFIAVDYPEHFQVPSTPIFPLYYNLP